MSQPAPCTRSYSFTNAFAAQPTMVFPGNSLDAELNNAKTTLDQILQNLALLQRDDGALLNGSVGPAQLSASLQIGFTVPTLWAPSSEYKASPASTVFENNKFYSCAVSHTSGSSFAADLASGKWALIADLSGIPLVTANQIAVTPAGGIVTTDVQSALQGIDVRTAASTNSLANFVAANITDSGAVGRGLIQAATTDAALAYINGFSTGDVKLTLKTASDPGWLMMNDGTIGAPWSAATYNNLLAQNLYSLLWANIPDAWAPVSGGRGGSAAADWTVGKSLALTKVLGRTLAVAGSGNALTARTLGQYVGEETHQLILSETPSHTISGNTGADSPDHSHSSNIALEAANQAADGGDHQQVTTAANFITSGGASNQHLHPFAVANGGGDGAHNNMQPTSFLNAMIKL